MNLAELRKRVAEVLGVSASQDELAYEVFTECVSEILTEGITLKVPHIGFFQIKTVNPKTKIPQQLLYSTLPEDYTKEARTLYLTIDVFPRIKNPIDFDSQVFSIGVGKPLLPLLDEDHDSETSFVLLRKSVEERVRELIAEADQIPNFNLWEDSFPQEEDEFDLQTDLNNQLSDLTKDYDIAPSNDMNEKQSTEDFLKLLLAQNNFQITDDFSTDINEDVQSPNELLIDIPPTFDDQLFDVLSDFSSPETSVDELLNESATIAEELVSEVTETITPQVEENKDEEIVDNIADEDEDLMFAEILEEEMKNIEDGEQLIISDLLADEDKDTDEDEEICIEPPTSTKYLLFDQIEEENHVNDSIHNWNIEHEHLQEIVKEELLEYDDEKIADENSKLLNQLLSVPIQESEKEVIKVDTPPVSESFITSQRQAEIPKPDESYSDEESDHEEKSFEKIEWSWGDELKEEFGVGVEEEIEVETNSLDDFGFEIEEEKKIDNEIEEIGENEEIDILASFAKNYTNEIDEKQPDEFDLRKTRVDLFTRLEKTLEKEVTFLKEKYDTHPPPENSEKIIFSKLYTEEKEPEIAFKDEKVFLDFKTPPPKYEFYEEKQEPILTKSRRISILLSPEEIVTPVPSMDVEPEPLIIVERPVGKKRYFNKLFVAILAVFIVSAAIVVYYLSNTQRLSNPPNDLSEPIIEQKTNQVGEMVSKNTIMEPTNDDISTLNLDEFSDFPRTATPPTPIKQGTDLTTIELPVENRAAKKVIENNIDAGQTKQNITEKVSSQKKDIYKIVQSDIRVNNMIFSDGKTFNFQHSSWRRKDLAEREVSRLRDQGFNAFLIEAYLAEKGGNWYRVRIGSFKTEQEAASFKNKNNF